MILSIRHTGLVVADLERSLHFWCDVLGFKLLKQMHESGPHIDAMMGLHNVSVITAKLAAPDGNILELLNFDSHLDASSWQGFPYSTGFTHIALSVDNLDLLFLELASEGVTFPAVPQLSPDGSVKVIYAKCPDGVLVELVETLES